nr:hypothetical protein [Tanacetum cinerariifolium]
MRTQKGTELPQTSVPLNLGADEAVNQEEGDRVERAVTTNASLEATQEKGHTFGSGEGRLEEHIELTDTVPIPYDSSLTGVYPSGSDEGRITLAELMETCTILSNRSKKLESQLKQKKSKEVIHSSEEEGPRIMQETELPKKLKKKEMIQLCLDEELAQKLYADELAKEEARQE